MAESITKVLLGDRLMFPSEYVAAVEFRGRDVTLTIAGVRAEQLPVVGGKKKPGVILTFKETPKKLVLNKTNAGAIADLLGERKAEGWIGKRVTFYPTTTKFGRATVDCIRVRSRARDTAPPDFDETPAEPDEPLTPDVFADPDGPAEAPDHVTAALDNLDPPGTTQRLAGLPATATEHLGAGPMTDAEKSAVREQEMRDAEAEKERLFK